MSSDQVGSISQGQADPEYVRVRPEQSSHNELAPIQGHGFGWQFREGQHCSLGEREVTCHASDFELANRPGVFHRRETSGSCHNRSVAPTMHTYPTPDAVVHARPTSKPPIEGDQENAQWLLFQQFLRRDQADPAHASVARDPVRPAPQANATFHPPQEEQGIGRVIEEEDDNEVFELAM
jgi:hypothetical protein